MGVKILGLDEAGRGPVLGPLIIAGVIIDEGNEEMLGEVKDSKLLEPKQRIKLSKHIREHFKNKIIIVHPKEIDEALDSENLNLNWLEAHKQAEIINELNPDVAIIDCPSPSIYKYTEYVRNLLNNKKIKLIVEHKADFNYPICSAASILAKDTRELEMQKIRRKYGDTGPGYPSSETTQKFIKENFEKHPEIFRQTWSTFKNLKKKKGQMKIVEY